jgi:hypothetical protein
MVPTTLYNWARRGTSRPDIKMVLCPIQLKAVERGREASYMSSLFMCPTTKIMVILPFCVDARDGYPYYIWSLAMII